MSPPIEFWFDFTSPYSYLAAEKIDELAARYGRTVDWHPILLGVLFKSTGAVPLIDVPLKGNYSRIDFERSARFMGLSLKLPERFPVATMAAARAFYWLKISHPQYAHDFAREVFRALFVSHRDVTDLNVLVDLANGLGAAGEALAVAVSMPEIKECLKQETAAALGKGIFGAPTLIVDGEMFWGVDRLPQVEHWLKTGGY